MRSGMHRETRPEMPTGAYCYREEHGRKKKSSQVKVFQVPIVS
jgi:hypothetical protein